MGDRGDCALLLCRLGDPDGREQAQMELTFSFSCKILRTTPQRTGPGSGEWHKYLILRDKPEARSAF